jgi:hypothetical protein
MESPCIHAGGSMKDKTTLTQFLKNIGGVDTQELLDRLSLYKNLQSKGIKDEVIINFLEVELTKRNADI